MPTGNFSSNSDYEIDVDASVQSQNYDENYSTIYWRVLVRKKAGSGFWGSGTRGYADSNVGGENDLWDVNSLSYDFRNGQSTGEFMFADGTFRTYHNAEGFGSYFVNGGMTLNSLGSASAGTGWRDVARIPKTPRAPFNLRVENIGVQGFGVRYNRPDDMGAGLIQDQAHWRRRDNGVLVWEDNGPQGYTSPLGGAGPNLDPGTEYRVGIRSRNSRGWGPWSEEVIGRTQAAARVKHDGTWRNAIPYVKQLDGSWRQAIPYIKKEGQAAWVVPS